MGARGGGGADAQALDHDQRRAGAASIVHCVSQPTPVRSPPHRRGHDDGFNSASAYLLLVGGTRSRAHALAHLPTVHALPTQGQWVYVRGCMQTDKAVQGFMG
jgi:hypothetical protein